MYSNFAAAGALGGVLAGVLCDSLSSRTGLTRARKLTQSVAFVGPAVGLLSLAVLGEGGTLTRDTAESIFIFSVGCQVCESNVEILNIEI